MHCEVDESFLLVHGKDGGAIGSGLIEVGLHRWPVVCQAAIDRLSLTEDKVDVHFWPVLREQIKI